MRRLDDITLVSPRQIVPADLPDLAAQGITTIVNNRPDGEEPGQPAGNEVAAAARAIGLEYLHIPVAYGFSGSQVAAMAEALRSAQGPVLAYCRSGTRSTLLWALARSRMGESAEALAEKASAAGYDLTPIRRFL